MSAGTFDQWQQVFTMSMLSNRDSSLFVFPGRLQPDLTSSSIKPSRILQPVFRT